MAELYDQTDLYDQADLYDLFENEERYNIYKRHWEIMFSGKNIHSLLDVSIGTGSVSLPLADLGIRLSGSDLSQAMLDGCRRKAARLEGGLELQRADFRDLSCWRGRRFDCVASTGNSLPHVDHEGVCRALEQMDSLVREGGFLYLDMRNWDQILKERNRFYLYNPLFRDGNRVNVVQVWDYEADGTMIFNILYTFERNDRIFRKEIFREHYFPISRRIVIEKLQEMGYSEIEVKGFPASIKVEDAELAEWHSIMARKTADIVSGQ